MKKVLITGANKGIGLEMAKQLAQKDCYVYMGSRNLENGLAVVKNLNAQGCAGLKKKDAGWERHLSDTSIKPMKAVKNILPQGKFRAIL